VHCVECVDEPCKIVEHCDLEPAPLVEIARSLMTSVVALNPGESKRVIRIDQSCQTDSFAWCSHACPSPADFDIHNKLERTARPPRSPRKITDIGHTVDGDKKAVSAGVQGGEPVDLRRCDNTREQEHARDSCVGEYLGFPKRRTTRADRSRLNLPASYLT
jgi:hypothetical protein